MPVVLTPNYLTGEAVAISVGGQLMFCKGGSFERSAAAIKVTNSRSGGSGQFRGGVKNANFSADLVYNGDSPPAVVEGTEVTVIFDSAGYETSQNLMNASTTPAGRLITAQVLITTVRDEWQVEGDYGVSISGVTTGAYTAVDTATGATTTT